MQEDKTAGRIFLLEDEASLRRVIRMNLEAEGYSVSEFETADSAFANLKNDSDYDIGILDIMTPGALDGISLLENMRKNNIAFPVIFLTAKNTLKDKLDGFEAGADDYLTKPFDLEELLVRIRVRLKKDSKHSRIGDFTIDLKAKKASTPSGETVRFNDRETAILRLLIENRGSPVTRDMILDTVWGTAEFPSNRSIDNFIVKFRKIFETDPRNPVYFITRHGSGYELSKESR